MRSVETHSARNPRLIAGYVLLVLMLAVLAGGLGYRQLFKSGTYNEKARIQNQRRVVYPGPRGNIYDREGRILVGNHPRFSVVLNLAELREEFDVESARIRANYRGFDPADRPSVAQRYRLARVAVVQRYLDQVNALLGRHEVITERDIDRHYTQTRLLPFVLVTDLAPAEYARLVERLPVNSPLQVYTTSIRRYPYGSAASHALGYVGVSDELELDDFPGEDLPTFKMRGSFGRDGLEKKFDATLQGEAGGAIYLVDHTGFKVADPLDLRRPVQGRNLTTSLDVDLQLAAEGAMADKVGAAVALDVQTGEALVLASKPDYDLNDFVPRLSGEKAKAIEESGGWLNRAVQGAYPTGSTFKVITAIAGLRAGAIDRQTSHTICPGFLQVGNRRFPCHRHDGHGERDLAGALRDSCNVFFYFHGLELGPALLAAEARRFGYDRPTGIELPGETTRMVVGDPEWKKRAFKEEWQRGDTANMAIGQGFLDTTPLQVACFIASFARGQTTTHPTMLHEANRPAQKSAPIGLAPADYATIIGGMEQCVQIGTGKLARVDGLRIAGKTGTAQKRTPQGTLELAWMIAFAPVENPQIAIAVVMEAADLDTNFGGGVHAAPVVRAVMEKWKEKREREPGATFQVTANR